VSVIVFAPEEYDFSLQRNIIFGHHFSAALFAAKADIEHFEQILSGFIWQVPKQWFRPGALTIKKYPFKRAFLLPEKRLYPVRFLKVSAQLCQAKRLINPHSIWLRRT